MYQCALQTIRLNNLTNVSLYSQSIGESNGSSTLKVTDESGLEMGPRSEIGNGIVVKMVKLDTFITEKIDLIHLDLEGYEFEALKGAKELIERDKPIIVLEIDTRAVDYNNFMLSINYVPYKQLIYNSDERMVFVNTIYKTCK
jgi:FkbM family methyltransferase